MHTLFHISILKFIKLQGVLLNYPFSLYVINAHTVSYLYLEVYQATMSVAQLFVQSVRYNAHTVSYLYLVVYQATLSVAQPSVQCVRYKCTHCFISLA